MEANKKIEKLPFERNIIRFEPFEASTSFWETTSTVTKRIDVEDIQRQYCVVRDILTVYYYAILINV